MDKTPFGKTDLPVSRLGFGAAPIGYLKTDQEKVGLILHELLDAGVNLIDTAACYPGSEEAIGKAVADRRDEYILVSKCGHATGDLTGDNFSPKVIAQSIDRSLRRLKTDRIDVMLLHTCDQATLEQGDALAAVVKARDAGKVRFAGYSGDNEAAAYAAGLDDVAVIETSVNIVDQRNIDLVLPVCRERNVGVIAKRPLANAAWKDLDAQPGMYSEYAADYTRRLKAMGVTPHDLGFRGHADVEWPEIALRFTLSQAGVHTAIVGTTSQVNARANIAAAGKRPLPEDVERRLRTAFTQAQEQTGDTWLALA